MRAGRRRGYGRRVIHARRAVVADAPEVARLRSVMLAAVHGADGAAPGPWVEATVARLRQWADDPDVAIMVVDRTGGLAACAVGTIEHTLGDPHNPEGLRGRIFNVATDPEHRRRGHARACLAALLAWFDARCVPMVDLNATAEGEPLYRDLGFVTRTVPAMRRARPTHT